MAEPGILIVDDHEVVREGIRTLLAKSRPNWTIAGEASNGREAVQAVQTLDPDVVVLDLSMPEFDGLQAARRMRQLALRARILIFTMHDAASIVDEVRASGAKGYVLKSQAARDLIRAIEAVHAGGTFFGSPDPASPAAGGKPDARYNPGIVFFTRLAWS